MSKLISQLPDDIKVVALQRIQEDTSNELYDAFEWGNTPEDYGIWWEVANDNYEPFRQFHANLKQSEPNGWISVEERLPEDDNIVCVFNNNMVILSCYYKGNWYRDDGYLIHPTHWQPLPPPPKN